MGKRLLHAVAISFFCVAPLCRGDVQQMISAAFIVVFAEFYAAMLVLAFCEPSDA